MCVQGQTAAVTSSTSSSVMGAVDVYSPQGESVCVDVIELVLTDSLYVCICVCIGCGRRLLRCQETCIINRNTT